MCIGQVRFGQKWRKPPRVGNLMRFQPCLYGFLAFQALEFILEVLGL
jgi:hypothetical protein